MAHGRYLVGRPAALGDRRVNDPAKRADSLTRVVLALALGAVAAAAQTAGQVILSGMPADVSTRAAIAAHPQSWIASHVLIAIAIVGYAAAVVLIVTAVSTVPAGARALAVARGVIAALALAFALTGVLVQGAVLGIDAVIGALAGATLAGGDETAGVVNRLIGEQVLPGFDAVDIGLMIALMLAALVLLVDRRGPALGPTVLIAVLAVPAFADLRIIAAALVGLGFAVALVAMLRGRNQLVRPRAVPLPAAVVIVVAVIPAALLSAERLVLALVVLAALTAVLAADRADRRASVAPMRTAGTES